MAKRVVWKKDDLVNIRLRHNLYTIGQMLVCPIMRFYDISNSHGEWQYIDLNECNILFRVFVGRVINRELIQNKIKSATVIASQVPCDPYWIYPYTIIHGEHYKGTKGSFPFLGGRLLDFYTEGKMNIISAPVIKEDLSLPEDRELIEKYELVNMWGRDDLQDRLSRYFDTGINRDDAKFEIFPGLWDDREALRPLTRRLPVPFR